MSNRILVVEDSRPVSFFLAFCLKRAGYEVMEVDCGGEALRAVERFSPDAVILDVELPDISGVEVCRRLRREFRHKSLAIVFCTALSFETFDEIRSVGADGHFPKPIAPPALIGKLRELGVEPRPGRAASARTGAAR